MPVPLRKLANERFVPLLGGAYTARSLIANAQRCVNLFPEKNQGDAETPVTHYLTPGLTLLNACPDGPAPFRGLYFASNNQLYGVVGQNVYFIDDMWTFHRLGQIPYATTPVSMVDDDTEILLVDGSQYGYSITLATNAFARITDPNFLGADRCDFVDTFIVSNVPGTQEWQSTLPNVFQWDPLYFASKTAFNDNLVSIIVMHREIWLIGAMTTEIWYNAGNAAFPFAILPGTFVEHGCAAKYSLCKHDLNVFFLSRDKDGIGMALVGRNYRVERISTHAMETAWGKYPTISDAVAYTYLQEGHIFWCINFPSGDATWVYDLQTNEWHERVYTDGDGLEHRHRAQVASLGYNNINVCGDWQNGNLYKLDLANGTDNCMPVVRRRGFPHLLTNGSRTYYASFRADIQAGEPPQDAQCQPHEIEIEYLPQLWIAGSSCELMEWAPSATGNVAPTINIQGTTNSVCLLTGPLGSDSSHTYGVDFDQQGNQYALNYWSVSGSPDTLFFVPVFAPNTTGDSAPTKRINLNDFNFGGASYINSQTLEYGGICVDASGNVYVGLENNVYMYPAGSSGNTTGSHFFAAPAKMLISSLCFDPVRNMVWIAGFKGQGATANPFVMALNLDGTLAITLDPSATYFIEPFQVSIGPDGSVYVADNGQASIYVFSTSNPMVPTRTLTNSGGGWGDDGFGVAVDGNSVIYVCFGNLFGGGPVSSISSYAAGSNGNVNGHALTTISGAATFLANMIDTSRTYPQQIKIPVKITSSMQVGSSTQAAIDKAKLYLRWSDDRGRTFGNPVGMSMGQTGQYIKQPQWLRLGKARDRVFELFWSGPQLTALNGAWVDALPMSS